MQKYKKMNIDNKKNNNIFLKFVKVNMVFKKITLISHKDIDYS